MDKIGYKTANGSRAYLEPMERDNGDWVLFNADRFQVALINGVEKYGTRQEAMNAGIAATRKMADEYPINA